MNINQFPFFKRDCNFWRFILRTVHSGGRGTAQDPQGQLLSSPLSVWTELEDNTVTHFALFPGLVMQAELQFFNGTWAYIANLGRCSVYRAVNFQLRPQQLSGGGPEQWSSAYQLSMTYNGG